jgi:hypothetical protein
MIPDKCPLCGFGLTRDTHNVELQVVCIGSSGEFSSWSNPNCHFMYRASEDSHWFYINGIVFGDFESYFISNKRSFVKIKSIKHHEHNVSLARIVDLARSYMEGMMFL